MTVTRHDRRLRGAALILAFILLLAAACGGENSNFQKVADNIPDGEGFDASGDDGAMEVSAEEPAPGGEARAQDDAGVGGEGGVAADADGLDPTALGRSIVYTATIDVVVDDVAASSRLAQTEIAGLGGLLFGQDTTTDPRAQTVLTFRVRPADFQKALGALEGLGTVQSQQISADDVTERVVDLQSRISTQEVSVERLRGLLDGAADLETIAGFESQLLERETELETLRGQLRTLEGQVDLATIVLTLAEVAPPAVTAAYEIVTTAYQGSDAGARCPGAEELNVDEGDAVTVCVQVTNVGNAALADVEIRVDGLDLDARDFTIVGAGAAVLTPDEQLLAWATAEAEPSSSARAEVTAVVVDPQGEPLRVGAEQNDNQTPSLSVAEDDSLPGFTDALSASWSALQLLLGVVVLVAGAAVPFLWLLLLIGAWSWWRRRDPAPVAASVDDDGGDDEREDELVGAGS